MIPYYNPHLYLSTVIKSIFIRNPEKQIQEYFKKYTGKKYILLTDSCRSALKLAYECLGQKGEVITSPLTCQVAIHPIIESGNSPKYIDIKKETLVMNEDLIEESISDNTIAIQAIHFGGTPCKMDIIHEIAKKKKIVLIEDCAQGYGAKYKGRNVGTWGDIACFSMMKNLYGIGGGVFATNNYSYFTNAKVLLERTSNSNSILSIYRTLLGIIEAKRKFLFFEGLYNLLKKNVKNSKDSRINIHRINSIEKRINYLQLLKSTEINKKRIKIGNMNLLNIRKEVGIENYLKDEDLCYSYTKFNIFSQQFDKSLIEFLNNNGIEAKHLEHKYGIYYQQQLIKDMKLINYNLVHDKLISIPIDKYEKDKIDDILLRIIKNG